MNKFVQFIKDWVYPGYYFKNYFFNRHDLIRLPVKRWQYCDCDRRMFYAVMELVKQFVEVEDGLNVIDWDKIIYKGVNQKYRGYTVGQILFKVYKFYIVEYNYYINHFEIQYQKREQMYQLCNQMFLLVCQVRRYMWT